MLVQLHHHSSSVLIVDLHERKESVLNVDCTFYLATVRPASISDDDQTQTAASSSEEHGDSEVPKPYLKVDLILSLNFQKIYKTLSILSR